MKSYEIKKAIKQYKIFNKDEDGRLYCRPKKEKFYYEVGKEHEADCVIFGNSGFHSCKRLTDCLSYYPISPSVVYAEVKVWGIIKEQDNIIASEYLKITKILSWGEARKILLEENGKTERDIEEDSFGLLKTNNIVLSKFVNYSRFIFNSSYIDNSNYINSSRYIQRANNVYHSYYVYKANNIEKSTLISYSQHAIDSDMISNSMFIEKSVNIESSQYIKKSNHILNSKYIEYSEIIINSEHIENSRFIKNCKFLQNCLFCYNIKAKENYLFNKKVSEERIKEIKEQLSEIEIDNYSYRECEVPVIINNLPKMKAIFGDNSKIPLYEIKSQNADFSNISSGIWDYIESLPEFDEKIFKNIIVGDKKRGR